MRILFSYLNLSDNISSWLFSTLVQAVGMGIIPLLLYKYWVKEDIVTGFSMRTKLPVSLYFIAIVIGFLLSYVTTGISLIWQNVLALLGYTHINGVGTIYSGFEVLVFELICTAVFPAIFEEITDRGLALEMFKDIEDERITIILIAILFGLGHQNIVQTGYAFMGGLVFAYIAVKTKSIIFGMIIHFINNAISVIGGYSSQTNGYFAKIQTVVYDFISNNSFLALISFIACGVLLVWLLKQMSAIAYNKCLKAEEESDSFGYYLPKKVQYIDDLFGTTLKLDMTLKSSVAWYQYAFLYASIALTTISTIYTFIWGIWR